MIRLHDIGYEISVCINDGHRKPQSLSSAKQGNGFVDVCAKARVPLYVAVGARTGRALGIATTTRIARIRWDIAIVAGTQYHRVFVLPHEQYGITRFFFSSLTVSTCHSQAISQGVMQEEEPGRRALPVSTNTTYKPHASGHQ